MLTLVELWHKAYLDGYYLDRIQVNTFIINLSFHLVYKYLYKYVWWEEAKRAYLKFINNEIIMKHLCTLRYTYRAYLYINILYTLLCEISQNNRLLHKKYLTQNDHTIHSKYNIHTEKTPTFTPVTP